jgi:hypothetical protein
LKSDRAKFGDLLAEHSGKKNKDNIAKIYGIFKTSQNIDNPQERL